MHCHSAVFRFRFVSYVFGIMSLLTVDQALNAVEASAALSAIDAELRFLLESSKIPMDIIAKIAHLGYTDVETFSHMESDPKALRKVFKEDVGLDPAGGPQHRAMVARLLSCWETAGKRGVKRKEEEASQRVGDLLRPLPKVRHLELSRAYSLAHRDLTDKESPAPSYLDWRFEQLEDGELRAEPLSDVVSKEEVADDEWGGARIGPDGSIKLTKSRSTGKAPESPEALRAKIRLMGVAWEFVKLRFPARAAFQDLSPADWSDHVDWLLGEEIYQNVVKDSSNTVQYRPSWATILDLDYRVRKEAYRLVNKGEATLAKALARARKDTALLQRYFITPVALAAGAEAAYAASSGKGSRRVDADRQPPSRPAEGSQAPPASLGQPGKCSGLKGSGKGKGSGRKGRGKNSGQGSGGKGKPTSDKTSWKSGTSNNTPDGRLKCFRYQRGNCDGNCGRVHSCLVCNGPHPVKDCPRLPKQGDAAGRAGSFN